MGLKDELYPYFDEQGLLGNKPYPSYWSGGNQLLESWTALVLLQLANEEFEDLKTLVFNATKRCRAHGFYDKNPEYNGKRRFDEITHDCLIGVSMGSAILGELKEAINIYEYGEENGWVLSNTGYPYYTAIAKPWHVAAYKLAAKKTPHLYELLLLAITSLLNAYFSPDNASGKRLYFLILEATSKRSNLMKVVYSLWRRRIVKLYGSLRRIFIIYHGEEHPFSKYCPLDRLYNTNAGEVGTP